MTGVNNQVNTNTTPVPPNEGGTGVVNSSTFTRAGAVTFSGAFPFVGNLTGNTSVTFPTSGTLQVASATALQSVNQQIFLSSGTYTPSATMTFCYIEAIGGGGAGGGAGVTTTGVSVGGGGGAGAYSAALFTAATIGSSQTVTVDTGGSGSTGAAGGNGGTTSVGSLITAPGGSGGAISLAGLIAGNYFVIGGTGASAGTTSSAIGPLTIPGSVGAIGISCGPTSNAGSGSGASTRFGGGAEGLNISSSSTTAGANAIANTGAGGSGAVNYGAAGTGTVAGGNGGSGLVIITEFCS